MSEPKKFICFVGYTWIEDDADAAMLLDVIAAAGVTISQHTIVDRDQLAKMMADFRSPQKPKPRIPELEIDP